MGLPSVATVYIVTVVSVSDASRAAVREMMYRQMVLCVIAFIIC